MPITIGSNLFSLKAQRRLGEASALQTKSSEQLSSGLRINRASDDAAGLAISSSLSASSRVYSQALRNVQDGISLLSIASGAMEALTAITIRQTELAEQAANGTYSAVQRAALDTESDALAREYERVLATTNFNGRSLLSAPTEVRIQAGFGTEGSLEVVLGQHLDSVSGGAQGDGTFAAPIVVSPEAAASQIILGQADDMNGDGVLDLVAHSITGNSINILLGNGDGSFKVRSSFSTGTFPYDVTVADFNGDSIPDIATPNWGVATVSVLLGNGNGTFKTHTILTLPPGAVPTTIHAGDLNGDSVIDLVAVGGAGASYVLIGNSNGSFKARVAYSASPGGGELADVNNDGILDIITNNSSATNVLLGNSNGTFKARASFASTTMGQIVDINGDGNVDIIADGQLHLGNGNGSFKASVSITIADFNSLRAIDLNGDGRLDLVEIDGTSADLVIHLGNGDGTFKAQTQYAADGLRLLASDFNGDGIVDILTEGTPHGFELFLGNASSSAPAVSAIELSSQSNARAALDTLAQRLSALGAEQGAIGAIQSRLQIAANNLVVTKENYDAASARIKDADIAEQSAIFTTSQIRQQLASAVLAQANVAPRLALSLLAN